MARFLIRSDTDTGVPILSVALGYRNGLADGVYEVVEIMDTLVIKRLGDSRLGTRVGTYDPNELCDMNGMVTSEEWDKLLQS